MVRPRLVEEGIPIVDQGNQLEQQEGRQRRNRTMIDDDENDDNARALHYPSYGTNESTTADVMMLDHMTHEMNYRRDHSKYHGHHYHHWPDEQHRHFNQQQQQRQRALHQFDNSVSSSLQKAASDASTRRVRNNHYHHRVVKGGFDNDNNKVQQQARIYHYEIGQDRPKNNDDGDNKYEDSRWQQDTKQSVDETLDFHDHDATMMTEILPSHQMANGNNIHSSWGFSGQPSSSRSSASRTSTHIEIGADTRILQRMEGVEDHGYKSPMVILDGANVAYAYSQALYGQNQSKLQPSPFGIKIVCYYLERAHLRIVVVLKHSYYRNQHHLRNDDKEWFDLIEHYLLPRGMLVLAPSSDDDDAYCLRVAQMENKKQSLRSIDMGPGYAYIISNDLYRDAQARDNNAEGYLSQYLNYSVRTNITNQCHTNTNELSDSIVDEVYGPGRISFTFVDMGTINDHGDKVLDFVPNPRHPLIQWIESLTTPHGTHSL